MKPIRTLWCVAAAALVVGCQDNPTDPAVQADEVTTPAFKAEHVDFIQEYPVNDIMLYPCLNDGKGEAVWERGWKVDYKGRVYASSENANRWTETLEFKGLPEDHPYYFGPGYTLLGLETGDVWTMDTSRSQAKARRHDKRDGFIYQQQWNVWYANQDGEEVHILDKYNLHCDYDWNCTKERIGGTCPSEWLGEGPPS